MGCAHSFLFCFLTVTFPQSFGNQPQVIRIHYRVSRVSRLNDLVDFVCPLSACGLLGDGGS